MATAIIPLITASVTELPVVVSIVKSVIGLFNHSKKAATPLTPDQATATKAAATTAAKTALTTAVTNGAISPGAVPTDADLENLIQAIYNLEGAGMSISAPVTAATPAKATGATPTTAEITPVQSAIIAALVKGIGI